MPPTLPCRALLGCTVGLLALASMPAHAASPQPVEAEHGMVVSDQALASQVGAEILRRGGNAVDAAVAVGYAQAVVNPCCGNLGGGGFMVVRLASGQSVSLDFRERAPLAATPGMYLDVTGKPVPRASLEGWRAVGVPGSVLGLDTALARYGTLPRAEVMAPAIRLAHDGFVLGRADADILAGSAAALTRAGASAFLHDGKPLGAGDRLVQPELAATLQAVADRGPDAFYAGAVAERMEAASRTGGGLITRADLSAYRVAAMEPVRCRYRDTEILTAAPPSGGGVALCEILGVLEGYPIGALGPGSSDTVHLMAEAMRHAYIDRNSVMGDPAFVHPPVARLTSPVYAAALRGVIDRYRATPPGEAGPATPPHEGTETTSYAVLDRQGNAVAVTYSLNAYFGAGVMVPGTGVFLNDTMDDFTTTPGEANLFGLVQGQANAIAPGKQPLSSMAPTIVLRGGKPFLVLGSPGGSRIITAVAETILNVVDHGMTIQEAVDAPRVHYQGQPDTLYVEPYGVSADAARALASMGYRLTVQKPWGAVEAILSGDAAPAGTAPPSFGDDTLHAGGPRPGHLYGANDSRRPAGAAVGE